MKDNLFDKGNNGGDVVYDDGGDAVIRQVVVATLDFVASEIKRNLDMNDVGVASVLNMVENLSYQTGHLHAKPRQEYFADNGSRLVADEDDAVVRRVVVATLDFVVAEIKRNLILGDIGVASVLSMVEPLSYQTGKTPARTPREVSLNARASMEVARFMH